MSRFLHTPPSPAMVVACIALSLAVAGSAVAATAAGTSTLDKKQVKKIAKREATKQINVKAGGLSVAHADTADNATNAGNADTVDGRHAAALESHGFSVTDETVTIVEGSTTTVQALDLPAGTYVVMGRAEFNNDDTLAKTDDCDCELRAGGEEVDLVRNMFLGANGAVGESAVGAGHLVATLGAPGQATIVCVATSDWEDGNALDPTITAISIQP